eukprot:TRINITY_DN95087_c0_g1_i1.p1 TRINITY_DN95087_c0_g1~~TRINITY_DN95087_c0_g1_i1.p1  ORF type:complete len:383 (-),score=54.59 TRINITY_DN95087_c0_g1_i1:47-1195(-)
MPPRGWPVAGRKRAPIHHIAGRGAAAPTIRPGLVGGLFGPKELSALRQGRDEQPPSSSGARQRPAAAEVSSSQRGSAAYQRNSVGSSTRSRIQKEPELRLHIPPNSGLVGYLARLQDELKVVVSNRQPLIAPDQLLDRPREDEMQTCLPLWRFPQDAERSGCHSRESAGHSCAPGLFGDHDKMEYRQVKRHRRHRPSPSPEDDIKRQRRHRHSPSPEVDILPLEAPPQPSNSSLSRDDRPLAARQESPEPLRRDDSLVPLHCEESLVMRGSPAPAFNAMDLGDLGCEWLAPGEALALEAKRKRSHWAQHSPQVGPLPIEDGAAGSQGFSVAGESLLRKESDFMGTRPVSLHRRSFQEDRAGGFDRQPWDFSSQLGSCFGSAA